MKEWREFKTWIALNLPHFLPLVGAVKVKRIGGNVVAATDGKTIYLGDSFFKRNVKGRIGVLLHELLHIAFLHSHPRRNYKINRMLKEKYKLSGEMAENIVRASADLIVNTVIEMIDKEKEVDISDAVWRLEEKLELLEVIYKDGDIGELKKKIVKETLLTLSEKLAKLFSDEENKKRKSGKDNSEEGEKSEEEEYKEAVKNLHKDRMEMNEEWKDIPIEDRDAEGDEETEVLNEREMEKEVKRKLQEGMVVARMRGEGKGVLEEIIENFLKGEIDWMKLFRRYLQEEKNRFVRSWRRIHRKKSAIFNYKLIFPGEDKELRKLKAVVGYDTSGSMGVEDFRKIVGEVYSILNGRLKVELMVIQCDYSIQKVDRITGRGDIGKIMKVKGRGGTSYIPVMEWIVERSKEFKNSILIYFTDFYGDQNKREFKELYRKVNRIVRRQIWVRVEGGKIKGVFNHPFKK